ncbi:hydroxyethylthiazole kinase [Siminovitchia sp. 179-K 8D1 HS]|uniref:hydroxyethylthiazole kinase n=1 Tax=Siminovitchia sp. 179-K 8D1 HS TaxID=3142385 RepID=UPI00399FFE5F
MLAKIGQLFERVRSKQPLIHQITNQVTINDCANVTLAIGGSPVMASSPLEAASMAKMANTLVINIGTLESDTFKAMKLAGKAANETGIPVLLDPVGVGSTDFRSECAFELLEKVKVSVISGNVSEMNCLAGGIWSTKGVDAGKVDQTPEHIAVKVARKYRCIAAVTGKEDVVSDGKTMMIIQNGHPLLSSVSGTGCMTTALIGCFAGATNQMLHAAVAGVSVMGLAGEEAASLLNEREGLGTYKVKLFDSISLMSGHHWQKGAKVIEKEQNELPALFSN